uniref:Uncharacterized protein n=1 Tax=Leptocylindrus danicus TaxID=163516 RepID=A0A7S2L3G1_9STRA|mmetsp:Transcript_30931/g.45306  ORF Transcript_30931/g.45306 Transcript_30931/m.45306 type:complete len:228 (+) Transcript_30931:297-980(+)
MSPSKAKLRMTTKKAGAIKSDHVDIQVEDKDHLQPTTEEGITYQSETRTYRTRIAFMGKAWCIGDFESRETAIIAYGIAAKVLQRFLQQHSAQTQRLGDKDIERAITIARIATKRYIQKRAESQSNGAVLGSKETETPYESKISEGFGVTQAHRHENSSSPTKQYPRIPIIPAPGVATVPVHPAAAFFSGNASFFQKASVKQDEERHTQPFAFNLEEIQRTAENGSD